MSLLGQFVRAAAINRIARGGRRRAGQRSWGYAPPSRAFARRSRGRTGFFGPMPYYSRQTRGGSRVAMSGCCLPIPLVLFGGLAVSARLLSRR